MSGTQDDRSPSEEISEALFKNILGGNVEGLEANLKKAEAFEKAENLPSLSIVNTLDKFGESPLQFALGKYRWALEAAHHSTRKEDADKVNEIVELAVSLLEHGANPFQKNDLPPDEEEIGCPIQELNSHADIRIKKLIAGYERPPEITDAKVIAVHEKMKADVAAESRKSPVQALAAKAPAETHVANAEKPGSDRSPSP